MISVTETTGQQISPKAPATAENYGRTQASSCHHHHHSSEEPMTKPLICSFFKRASAASAAQNCANDRGSASGRVSSAATLSTHSVDAETPSHLPPYPTPMEEPILLFPLTPSVKVPLRHSKRSGRVLNESETLQEKHAQEYRFIVPMLAYAIECTIAEHEIIRQSAGLPAYISLNSSPAESPTRQDPHVGASENEGENETAAAAGTDRNAALGYKVFQTAINAFSTREVPAISVHDYLKRIVKYTYVSPSVLVCCCLYLDRLLVMYPSFLLHPNNVFKFLITSTRVCSKVMDTRTLNNRDFSVVGGVTNEDINVLEFTFVQLLQNRLYISRHTFDMYCEPLRRQAAHVEAEGEWDGVTLTMVLPVNGGGRSAGYPHQPSRPSQARNSACGSAASRSRRSSTVSQNEYSLSMASQSGVSLLRSASRPAFPPSASTGQPISVDAEFLAPVRQPSAATVSSARRHPLSSSTNNNTSNTINGSSMNNTSTTSRSPVLPQVHPPAAGNAAASTAVPIIRNVGSAATLRSSSNFEDTASSGGLAQSDNGTSVNQLQPQPQSGVDAADDGDDAHVRSIPVSGPRGFSSSWDTVRTTRTLAATAGGMSGVGLSTSTITNARCGSPNAVPAGAGASMSKSRSLDGVTISTEGNMTPSNALSGERTPTRRAFVSSARGDNVALPPVPQNGRRGRSNSLAGNTGATIPNVPPPPEFRQRQ
ncbi:Cyclin 10 [Lotmaria passim]